jgi:hypothetical protein
MIFGSRSIDSHCWYSSPLLCYCSRRDSSIRSVILPHMRMSCLRTTFAEHLPGTFRKICSMQSCSAEENRHRHLKVAATIQVMSGKHVCTQVTQAKESEVGDRIRERHKESISGSAPPSMHHNKSPFLYVPCSLS